MASGKATQQADFVNPELKLSSPSFIALLVTQWLTAINDNVFRWLVIGVGKDFFPPADIGYVLMMGTACFVAPYLVLAAPAGYLADRFSKRHVIVACKIAEIAVMTLGIIAIMLGSFNFLLFVVVLMGAQSALFAPSKMGTIPELLGANKISAANGWFGLSTVSATIIGMAIGGWLADLTAPRGVNHLQDVSYLWVSAVILIGLAAIGTAVSLIIRPIPAANPKKKFPILIFPDTFKDLLILFSYRALFVVALGKVFFWSVGVLTQLNIDAFAAESGALGETERLPLLVAMVFGVGVGSVLAGVISAGRIELGMLWLGAIGIFLFATLVFFVPDGFMSFGLDWNSGYVIGCLLLGGLGISAGLFDVPLSSYLQHKSPREKRGSVLAANNFMLFSGMLAASVLFYAMRAPTYEGSMKSVLAGQTVSDEVDGDKQIQQIRDEFAAAWDEVQPNSAWSSSVVSSTEESIDNAPSLEEYWNRGEDGIREPLLANLLWVEMQSKRKLGYEVIKNQYYDRFRLKESGTTNGSEDSAMEATESDEPGGKNPALVEGTPAHRKLLRLQLVKKVFEQSGKLPLLTARQIFLVVGMTAIPVVFFVLMRLPQASLRFLLWPLFKLTHRVSIEGQEHFPENSGALLVSNRCSNLDKLMLTLSTERKIQWITNDATQKEPGFWGRFWGEINIGGTSTRQQQALADARKALKRGEFLAVFPEAENSATAQLQSFDETYANLIRFAPVPIIPTYIDKFWGSRHTQNRGRGFWKLSRMFRRPVSIQHGEAFRNNGSLFDVRQSVQKLGASPVSKGDDKFISPPQMFIRRCKQRKFRFKAGDLSGASMTGGVLLMRTLITQRLIRRHVLNDDDRTVGVLLPPSVGGVVVNAALALDKRVAINLNYTASSEILNACLKQAGIEKILTSERVVSKLDLNLDAEIILLDDLRKNVTTGDKLHGAIGAYVKPAGMLERSLGIHGTHPNEVLTIVFTSGSTGIPKGVMLTHRNVATNVEAIQNVVHLTPDDTIVGILPFFHSFGYTVTLWGSMGLQVGGIYHYTPLDGKQVGRLIRKFKGTCMLATPTFLRTYLRRTPAEDFASLDIVVAGAEKLPKELADAFEKKFGTRPVEGYGATELSPLVSVNVPPRKRPVEEVDGIREGSVGRPIPNVAAKITDLETGEELSAGEAGMLWISGPNVMRGYLGRDDLTSEVVHDGWYRTGDVAYLDEDGYIMITGRQSRFSKIGGEMVPHIQIEETLAKIIGADEEEGPKAVVTSVPHEKKGERLVVLHTEIEQSPQDLITGLKEAGLPNLYSPSADSFVQVDEIPVLGTGKLDLHSMKKIAMDKFIGNREV